MTPELSVVIPTIRGREHWLAKTVQAFRETTPVQYETVVVHNKTCCGRAWNEGVRLARGDYVLLAADDLEPQPGWWEAGKQAVDRGVLPSARVLNTDGTIQSCGDLAGEDREGRVVSIARVPFASASMLEFIGPILEIHYATDNWFSHRGRLCGWPSVVTRGFCFTHHFAMEGRVDHRVMDDMRVFWRAAGLAGEPVPAAL